MDERLGVTKLGADRAAILSRLWSKAKAAVYSGQNVSTNKTTQERKGIQTTKSVYDSGTGSTTILPAPHHAVLSVFTFCFTYSRARRRPALHRTKCNGGRIGQPSFDVCQPTDAGNGRGTTRLLPTSLHWEHSTLDLHTSAECEQPQDEPSRSAGAGGYRGPSVIKRSWRGPIYRLSS